MGDLVAFSVTQKKLFIRMIAVSLLLHAACCIYAISGKYQRATGSRPFAILDLNMTTQATPETKQPKPAASLPVEREAAPSLPAQPQLPSELEKLQNDIRQNVEKNAPVSEDIQRSSFGLGLTRGFFRSLAEGENLRPDIRNYYFEMLSRINEKWWLDPGIDRKGIKEVIVSITVARNGAIVAKQMLRRSGSIAYDNAVLKALETAGPLPPLPDNYNGDFFQAPIRLVAPLNLLAS